MSVKHLPDGRNTPLEGSPYRYAIHSYFISGEHPIAIARILQRTEGVELSPDDIAAYCRTVPAEDVKPGALSQLFDNKLFVTDPIADMHKLILVQQKRVSRLVRIEDGVFALDKKKAINPTLTHQLTILQRMEKELVLLEDKVGIKRHAPAGATARIARPRTLQDLVEDAKHVTMIERTVSFDKGEDVV